MEASGATADISAVLLHTTFFADEERPDEFQPAADLRDVSDAINTIARFLDASFLLAEWDELSEKGELTAQQRINIARKGAEGVEIVSVSMGSPLKVVLKIPASVIEHIASSAIRIGAQICEFPSRVGAGRAENKLRKAVAERQTTLVQQGRADAIVLDLLAGTPGHRGVRPAHMDYTDADAEEEPMLVQLKLPRATK